MNYKIREKVTLVSSGRPADGEVAAVGKHAPYPFEGAEAEIVKPQLADGYLEEEDDDSRQFDGNEAESGAKSKSQAVEQDGTNDRLHDVTRQRHPSGQPEGPEPSWSLQE